MLKILDIDKCPSHPMDNGRGETVPLINAELGTEKVDLHLNRLKPGGAGGLLHRHSQSDNVYIVVRGEGRLVVDRDVHTIRANQVVYIPAGMPHSLSNVSEDVLEIFEIYAPAGRYHDFELVK